MAVAIGESRGVQPAEADQAQRPTLLENGEEFFPRAFALIDAGAEYKGYASDITRTSLALVARSCGS